MPFITREDGENFIIPSYRDVVTSKQSSALKKEVTALSQSYGEYITLQRKGKLQFEVAFSTDLGYLLGETVWYKFNRPSDMIYCEAVPNSTEAILVIVKNGSVYLDGSFQIDSIPEELIIFLTQQNDFEIFVYGDIPISATAEEGKFSFDEGSVKSFTVLEEPVFNSLPLVKAYRFQTVDAALKSQGIGTLPIKAIAVGILAVFLSYYIITNFIMEEEKKQQELPMEKNPYEAYVNALASPRPDDIINAYISQVGLLNQAPGWTVTSVEYKGGSIAGNMSTRSGTLGTLYSWCNTNKLTLKIVGRTLVISYKPKFSSRKKPKRIYPLKDVMVLFIDRLTTIYPDYRNITISKGKAKGPYSAMKVAINFKGASPQLVVAIGQTMSELPLVLSNMSFRVMTGRLNGKVVVEALGN